MNDITKDAKLSSLVTMDKIDGVVRIPKEFAKELLLNNRTIIRNGQVHYLAMRDLGLGVCELGLRPAGKINTYLVKSMFWNER